MNIWFSFNGWGQILGGVVSYGIARGSDKYGSAIAPWKAVFLWAGLLTVVLGFLFLWFVPDNQLNARWLKKEDRILAVARVKDNQQGIGNKHFKLYQVKEALLDPMAWAFFFYALIADIPNGGLTNFFSRMVSSPSPNFKPNHSINSPDRRLRLQQRAKPPPGRSRRRGGSHLSTTERLRRRKNRPTHPRLSGRSRIRHSGHDPDRCAATIQRGGPINRVLHDASKPNAVRGAAIVNLVECCRVYEEDDCCGDVLNRVLRWEYNRYAASSAELNGTSLTRSDIRPPNLPPLRRPALRPRRSHDYRLLGHLSLPACRDLAVV